MKMGKSGFIRSTGSRTDSSGNVENLKTVGNFKPPGRSEGIAGGPDYSVYRMSAAEWIKALAAGAGLAGGVAYAFYRSWILFVLLLIPAEAAVPFYLRGVWHDKQLKQLERQFKEAIQMLSTFLSAGLSVENAIASAGKELELLYGSGGMICRELAYMVQQMGMNRPVEELMSEFAWRSGLEEVDHFARIFRIAKRSGGQLVPIITHTVQIMDERFLVKEEIRTLTASRQFEQKVMNMMPFLMILYIDGTSPGFFDVMYTTAAGRLIMTVCLAVYLLACWLAKRILDIPTG